MSDPKLPIGTKYCLCSGCGEYFTNETSFAMHRHAAPTGRVCVDPRVLRTKKGKARLRLNAKGYWARPGGVYAPKG